MNIKLVEQYQCPGCVCGSDVHCGYAQHSHAHEGCNGHVPGTSMFPGNISILLGLPKGFNRLRRGTVPEGLTTPVRIFPSKEAARYNDLNVPVWARQDGENVVVRCFQPRLNVGTIDVIANASLERDFPGVFDASKLDDRIA